MNALETAGLGKRYRRRWAPRDCSLGVPTGRVAAVVGPNGAGKTTLLHVAMGLLASTTGQARVFGMPTHRAQVRERTAFVAQDKPLYDAFRVTELLRLGRSLNPRWDHDFAVGRLKELQVPLEQRAGKLSGGQRAQVAITLALAKRPDLLLLDEPLANLDPLARVEMMGHLMAIVAERNMTVLLSSHIIADLADTCDWLVVLNNGRVQVAGDIEQLLTSHHLLSGVTEAADRLPASVTVIARDGAGRQAHLVVRTDRQLLDPRWTVRPVDLGELVLAYLRAPDVVTLPGPLLVSAATEGDR